MNKLKAFTHLCLIFLIYGSNVNAQKESSSCDLFFLQEPVKYNSPYMFDGRIQSGGKTEDMKRFIENYVKSKKTNFDSVVSFITNFKFQKNIIFRYEDTSQIRKLYNVIAYRIFQNSFFLPIDKTDFNFEIKEYNKNIYDLGKCLIFEFRLQNKNFIKQNISPGIVYLIFESKPNISRLPVSCLSFCADSISWQELASSDKLCLPILVNNKLDGRGHMQGSLSVPIMFDRKNNRFIPIAHFIQNN